VLKQQEFGFNPLSTFNMWWYLPIATFGSDSDMTWRPSMATMLEMCPLH